MNHHTKLNATYRRLTTGEISLAITVYQDSLNYDTIRIHKGRLIPLFQNSKVAMSPFGTMHFPAGLYVDDFSTASLTRQHLFIHEMAHVWQYQLGLNTCLDGIILGLKGGYRRNACYAYDQHIEQCQRFNQLNMEQQADLIADWFIFKHTQNHPKIKAIMSEFIHNPSNVNLLPTHAEFRFQAA